MHLNNIEHLINEQKDKRSPGQWIGKFLLEHSNSPEYLIGQLEAYLEAARADLAAERAVFTRLMKKKEEVGE